MQKLNSILLLLLISCQGFKSQSIPQFAFKGNLEKVRTYVESGGNIEIDDEYGFSLLHRAVMGGSLEIVTYLVNQGADVNRANDIGMTPLTLACDEGNKEILAFLLKHGANPNYIPEIAYPIDVFPPLHVVASTCDPEIVSLLIQNAAEVDLPAGGKGHFRGWSPLMLALLDETDECLKVLLSNGANPNFRVVGKYGPITPFSLAAVSGNTKRIEILKSFGIPQDQTLIQSSLLRFHIKTGQIDLARENVAAGADILLKGFLGKPLLYIAAASGQADSIRYLLDLDCDPNEKTALGETPLMAASHTGSADVTRILLEAGADRNLMNEKGLTALDIARKKGHQDIVDLLQTE